MRRPLPDSGVRQRVECVGCVLGAEVVSAGVECAADGFEGGGKWQGEESGWLEKKIEKRRKEKAVEMGWAWKIK